MSEAGEFSLHPHELLGILNGFFFGLCDMTTHQITPMFRSSGKAGGCGRFVVQLPDLFALLNRRVEYDVGIPVLSRPDNSLTAHYTGNPYARVWLLQRQHPGINYTQLIVVAFPAEWPRL